MRVLGATRLFVLTGLSFLLALSWAPPSRAANGVDVYDIPTNGMVDGIISSGDRVIIQNRNTKHQRLRIREGTFTLEPVDGDQPIPSKPPEGSLPDGEIAIGSGRVRRVWLSSPTTRYDHGVLGDAIEAGAVSAELSDNRVMTYVLPKTSVFEDRIPRLIDIDGDGEKEILLIKSWLDRGAALAVISLNGNRLELRAEAEPIGLSHRWLNPVGVGDFDNDGRTEIAAVITPHIGGTLQLYEMKGNRLTKDHAAHGFSNHQIGSRNLGLSVVADVNGDQIPDLIVPDASRRNLLGISFATGDSRELFRVPLNDPVSSPLRRADLDHDGRDEIVFASGTNRLKVICLHP